MIKVLLKLVFIGCALFLVFSQISFNLILQTISKTSSAAFVCSFATLLISQLVTGLRLNYYLRVNNINITRKDSISLYFATLFLNVFLPSGIGGDGVKILYLSNKFHISKLRGLQIALSERANGLYLLIAVVYLLVPFMPIFATIPYNWYIYITTFIFYNFVYFVGVSYFLKEKPSIAFGATYYSSFVQLFSFLSAFALFSALIHEQDIASYLVLFALSSIATILPFSIGGVGLRELTFLGLSPLLGLDSTVGVSFCLIYFTTNLLVSALGGVFVTKHLGNLYSKTSSN